MPKTTKNEVTKMEWDAHLEPIQKRYAEVRADEDYLRSVLKEGADAADEIAQRTLTQAKVAMGFSIPK